MPVIQSKGLVTNELLFTDDLEVGNLSNWTLVGSLMTLETSITKDSYAIRSTNGGASASTASRIVGLSTKPRTFSCEFYIDALDVDDAGRVQFKGNAGMTIFAFNAARESGSDPLRRFQMNNVSYITLNLDEWYKLIVSDINFSTDTFDFEVRNNVDTVVSSDTGVSFQQSPNDGHEISLVNQTADTVGSVIWDNFEIRGKGI